LDRERLAASRRRDGRRSRAARLLLDLPEQLVELVVGLLLVPNLAAQLLDRELARLRDASGLLRLARERLERPRLGPIVVVEDLVVAHLEVPRRLALERLRRHDRLDVG